MMKKSFKSGDLVRPANRKLLWKLGTVITTHSNDEARQVMNKIIIGNEDVVTVVWYGEDTEHYMYYANELQLVPVENERTPVYTSLGEMFEGISLRNLGKYFKERKG